MDLFYFIFFMGFGVFWLGWGIVLALRYHRLKRGNQRAIAEFQRLQTRLFGNARIVLTWTDDQEQVRQSEVYFIISRAGLEINKHMKIYYDDSHAMLVEYRQFRFGIVVGALSIALALLFAVIF
jgi:hypothetical protein